MSTCDLSQMPSLPIWDHKVSIVWLSENGCFQPHCLPCCCSTASLFHLKYNNSSSRTFTPAVTPAWNIFFFPNTHTAHSPLPSALTSNVIRQGRPSLLAVSNRTTRLTRSRTVLAAGSCNVSLAFTAPDSPFPHLPHLS